MTPRVRPGGRIGQCGFSDCEPTQTRRSGNAGKWIISIRTDVLDHATSEIASGSKLGIDATKKIPGEGFKKSRGYG